MFPSERRPLVRAFHSPGRGTIDLYIVVPILNNAEELEVGAVTYTRGKTDYDHEPAVRIPREQAQSLMDDLWSAGLRPAQAQGTAGQHDAMKQHIEDLRHVVKTLLPRANATEHVRTA